MAGTAMRGTAGAVAFALLLLFSAGCARSKPDAPISEPKAAATPPAAPRAPARPAPPKTAPAAIPARAAKDPAPKAAGTGAPPVVRTPAAATPLDLKALTQQLRQTKAIGVFTKIT